MIEKIRDSKELTAWEIGDAQIAITGDGRVHLIHGKTLNVSVALGNLKFHAGDMDDLKLAMDDIASKTKP